MSPTAVSRNVRRQRRIALVSGLLLLTLAAGIACAQTPSVAVTFDRAEAEAALVILDKNAAGQKATDADWRALFGTTGYLRLQARETGMGRAFTDEDFKAFLDAPRTPAQVEALRKTLDDWSSQSIDAPAAAARAYLPADARLKATVFPTIKPRPNEFVYDLKGDPAIFLYLDPAVSGAKARNTMAHELHHIGLGSVCPRETAHESETGSAAALRKWISAFGEGLAMLAAAGGPDAHPHAASKPGERAEWDANIARFDQQLAEQNAFFLAVLDGKAGDEKAVERRMMGYFGVQGPWYTVGWKMAVTIETQLGRERAISAFCDSRRLLAAYDEAARLRNRDGAALPLWDPRLVRALAGESE